MDSRLRRCLLQSASDTNPDAFCRGLTTGLADAATVLARIWVADPGGDLRLVASSGNPTGGGSYHRVDGAFSRVALGAGKIGRIAATREPFVVRNLRGDEDWLANPGWIARQGVRGFAGYPLLAGGDIFGVVAIFDRTPPSDESLDALQLLSDYTAERLRAMNALGPAAPVEPEVLTRAELRAIEKRSLEAALAATRGKVFGHDGAAALLGMKPTTLASRIKTLGLNPKIRE